jgi:hypothetical protein
MEMVLFSVLPLLPRGAAKAVIFENVFGTVQRTVPKHLFWWALARNSRPAMET